MISSFIYVEISYKNVESPFKNAESPFKDGYYLQCRKNAALYLSYCVCTLHTGVRLSCNRYNKENTYLLTYLLMSWLCHALLQILKDSGRPLEETLPFFAPRGSLEIVLLLSRDLGNGLPVTIRQCSSATQFKSKLKTYLFSLHYD